MFSFNEDKLLYKMSLMIGSARMHEKFVENIIPTPEEARALYEYIYKQISEHTQLSGYESIYAIGGSARCAFLLYNKVFDKAISNEIDAAGLERVYLHMIDNPEESRRILEELFPDRVKSLLTGIITLCAICRCVGAKKLVVAVCGVREGFIYKEIL